jgi:hypothetical protein
MNKKFNAVEFQQEQRAKLSTRISKMSDKAILEFLNSKPSTASLSKSRRKRTRAKV